MLKDAGVQIAPQTYYAAKSRAPSKRSITDAALTEKIKDVHEENYSVYGARKVYAQLLREDVPVARCTVERLMRAAGLQGVRRAAPRAPKTTISGTGVDHRSDLVERSFAADAPNRLWVADITYIRTFSG